MKEKNMKNKSIEIEKSQEKKTRAKGITLIALVVTVVILLILAGISINLVLGENGIISKAQESRLKSDNATVSDSLKMMIARYSIDDMGEGKTDVLARLNSDGITDANDVINVPVLVGKKLGTGNGSGTRDVYVIENNKLYYYDKKGKKTDLGDIDNLQFSGDKQESGIFVITSDGTVYMKDRQSGFYSNEYERSTKEVIIPSEINGIKVKKLGDYMFCNYNALESVGIPDSVTEIGNGVFYGCWKIANIVIPDNVKSIGKEAFLDCNKLTSVIIPDGITEIGNGAFCGCSEIANIVIPDNVKNIGEKAFAGCNKLTSVIIPDGVTSIGDLAFAWCSGLENIKIPDSVKKIGGSAFRRCSELTSIIIPDSVTSIGEYAFANCTKLASIIMPENIKDLNVNVFEGTAYLNNPGAIYIGNTLYKYNDYEGGISLTIKDGIEKIDQGTFSNCEYLTSIIMPDTVTEVGSYAFSNCTNLSSIKLSSNINEISNNTFSGCTSLNSIAIPENVVSIFYSAFENCTSLTNIKIPAKVEYIARSAFKDCTSLSEITFSGDNNYIDSTAFDNTAWLNNQNDGVVYIGKLLYCYKGEMPSNTTITVKDGTEAIGAGAFAGKKELIEVVLPNSVKRIESSAFYECSNLSSITIPDSVEYVDNQAFQGTAWLNNQNDGVVYIGKLLYCYKGKMPSNTTITVKDGTETIADGVFAEKEELVGVVLPNSVKKIGSGAFYGCPNLSSINIPDSIEYVGDQAFEGTAWLNNQNDGVVYIGKTLYCYKGEMPSNTTITVKEGTTNISGLCFEGCTNLASITIPKSVTYIGMGAFFMCDNLKTINYKGSKEDWNNITIEIQAPDGSGITATINYNYK